MTETDDALAALEANGLTHPQAIAALAALIDAGFIITRPQSLLDRIVCNALEVDQ